MIQVQLSFVVNLSNVHLVQRPNIVVVVVVVVVIIIIIINDKEIPLQAWTSPEVSRRLRLPYFKTLTT